MCLSLLQQLQKKVISCLFAVKLVKSFVFSSLFRYLCNDIKALKKKNEYVVSRN